MRFSLFLAVGLASGLAVALPAGAVEPEGGPDGAIVDTQADLRPGRYVWHPELAPPGPVEMIVSISQQRAYVFQSGELIGLASVSTGTDDHPTPTGRFRILQKERIHGSNKYDDAPMPFMMRLTWDGVAIHGGRNPGFPASHGCIRLPIKFAEALFAAAPLKASVVITDEAPATSDDALALARSNPDAAVATAASFPVPR